MRRLKKVIVLLVTMSMLFTGSGISVFAEAVAEGQPAQVETTKESEEPKSETAEEPAEAEEEEAAAEVGSQEEEQADPEQKDENQEDAQEQAKEENGQEQKPEEAEQSAEQSDSKADVEKKADWENTLPAKEDRDILSVAKSQLGYKESKDNYKEDKDGIHHAYTRYGAFLDEEYADPWDAGFVQFVLHYAGVENVDGKKIPEAVDTEKWMNKLKDAGLTAEKDYTPVKGDVVFFASDAEDVDVQTAVISKVDGDELTVIGATVGEERDSVDRQTVSKSDVKAVVATAEQADEEQAGEKEEQKKTEAEKAEKDEAEEAREREQKEEQEKIAAERKRLEDAVDKSVAKTKEEIEKAQASGQKEHEAVAEVAAAPDDDPAAKIIGKLADNKTGIVRKGTNITVSGLMPEKAIVKAYPVVVEVPGQDVLAAYDITIYVEDENGELKEWQPVKPLRVSVTDKALKAVSGKLNIYHMENRKASSEYVQSVTQKNGAVGFRAESFSIYVITHPEEGAYVNYRFWLRKADINDSGKTPYRVVSLKDGETLHAPASPTDTGMGKFQKWIDNETGDEFLFTDGDGNPVKASVPENAAADINVDIYADFDGAQYATFMSLPLESMNGKRAVYHTAQLTATGDTYSIDLKDIPSYGGPDGYRFVGWTSTMPTDNKGYGTEIESGDYYTPDQEITGLTDSVKLYPVVKKGYTVAFNGNDGKVNGLGTYKIRVVNGEKWSDVLAKITKVERSGYSRDGQWFQGTGNDAQAADLTGTVDLEADATYYAHWTPGNTKVIVKYWKENVEKDTYALMDSEEFSVQTGSSLTVAKSMQIGNKSLDFETIHGWIQEGDHAKVSGSGNYVKDSQMQYFSVADVSSADADGNRYSVTDTTDKTFTVAEDGSTVVNVWIDRKEYTLNFHMRGYAYISGGYYATAYIEKQYNNPNAQMEEDKTYTVRLGESLVGKWPNYADYNIMYSNKHLYSITGIGERAEGTDVFPDAIKDGSFSFPLAEVNETLLDDAKLKNGRQTVDYWAKYEFNYSDNLGTYTVNEYFQQIDSTEDRNNTSSYYGAKTDKEGNPISRSQRSRLYEGYVLDAAKTKANNTGKVEDYGNAGTQVAATFPDNNTVNFYYNLDTYKVNLMYGKKPLANTGKNVKYTENVSGYLSEKSSANIKTIFEDPSDAAGVPEYLTFKGWYRDEEFTDELKDTDTMPAADMELYAKFEADPVTVEIDRNTDSSVEQKNPELNLSGSELSSKVSKLTYESDATHSYRAHAHTLAEYLPTYWVEPIRDNHVFLGWEIRYKEGDEWGEWSDLADINVPVDKSVQLRANWQDMTRHTVHYFVEGKEEQLDSNAYLIGKKAIVKGCEKELYDNATGKTSVFRYWYRTDDPDQTPVYPGDELTIEKEDISLTAVFSEGNFSAGQDHATYKFMVDDEIYYEEIVYRGERLSPPPVEPEKEGKSFAGWYLDPDHTKRFVGFGTVNAPKDTTLYAGFEKPYRVTYHGLKDGELVTIQNYSYKGTDKLNTSGVGKSYKYDDNHRLIGWSKDKLEPGVVPGAYYSGATDLAVDHDIDLYPVLESGYLLIFNTMGGDKLDPRFYSASENLNFTWPDPSDLHKKNYVFTGKWYEDEECTKEFDWNTTLTENTTIYAGWRPGEGLKSKYTVVWWVEDPRGDGYSYSNAMTVKDVDFGTKIGLNTLVKSDKVTTATAASSKDHLNLESDELDFFKFEKAEVTSVNDQKWSISGNETVAVDDSGKTTLNVYFKRVRYTITFKLNGNGTIRYGNQNYTNTWSIPGGGWYQMPYAGKWPMEDADGVNVPKLTMNTGKTYNRWEASVGSHARTVPVVVQTDNLDKSSKEVVFTLTTAQESINTYYAKYRFRDDSSSAYLESDYRGNSYDQSFDTLVNFVTNENKQNAKKFEGYSIDYVETSGDVYELADTYNTGTLYYYQNKTYGNKINVSLKPGTGTNKLDIVHTSDGTKYTGTYPIYYNSSKNISANDLREGKSPYVVKKSECYTYFYTRNAHKIMLYDAEGNHLENEDIPMKVGESLSGKIKSLEELGINVPEGKEFHCWSYSSTAPAPCNTDGENAAVMPDSDLRLDLFWKIKEVTVTALDEQGNTIDTFTREYGTSFGNFDLPVQTKEGYSFSGWTSGDKVWKNSDPVTGDITVSPTFSSMLANKVIYDLNGGKVKAGANGPVIENTTLNANGCYVDNDSYFVDASVPVKALDKTMIEPPAGKVAFAYWNTEPNGTGDSYYPNDALDVPSDEDITLYAIYSQGMEALLKYKMAVDGYEDIDVLFLDYRAEDRGKSGQKYANQEYNVGTGFVPGKDGAAGVYSKFEFDSDKKPVEEINPGYHFAGWKSNDGKIYKDGTEIRVTPPAYDEDGQRVADVLTAQWEKDELPVEAYKEYLDDDPQLIEGSSATMTVSELYSENAKKFATDYHEKQSYSVPEAFIFHKLKVYVAEEAKEYDVDEVKYAKKTDASKAGYSWQYKKTGSDSFQEFGEEDGLRIYYAQLVSLTVENQIDMTSPYAVKTDVFGITVTLKKADDSAITDEEFALLESEEAEKTLAADKKTVTFAAELGDDGSCVISSIPVGWHYSIEEEDNGYSAKYNDASDAPENVRLTENTTVKITNAKLSVPATGVDKSRNMAWLQFLLILLIAIVAAAGGIYLKVREAKKA